MSNRKRKNSEELDPENRQKQGNIFSENAPSEEMLANATRVLVREFNKELELRKKEIFEIQERLYEVLKIQHFLRFAVVMSYYGLRTSQVDLSENMSGKHLPHPAVAGLMRKSRPDKFKRWAFGDVSPVDMDEPSEDEEMNGEGTNLPTKIPRYIPPVSKGETKAATSSTRGSHVKIKQRIIVGNVSRWLSFEDRDDGSTHKWMVYVRGPRNAANLSHIIKKVRIFLHESYRPFDVVEVDSSPFRIARRGWGEFRIRVQVHFHNPLNKPVDIIHQLTLEKTQSIKESLGSETIVDVWLYADEDQQGYHVSETNENEENDMALELDSQDNQIQVKTEIKEEVVSDIDDAQENSASDCETEIVNPGLISDCLPVHIKTEEEVVSDIDDAQENSASDGETEIVNPGLISDCLPVHIKTEEEVVIEDGCFDMSYDNDAVKDIPAATEGFSVAEECPSSVTHQFGGKQQRINEFTFRSSSRNIGSGGPSVLTSQSGVSRPFISCGNNQVFGCFGSAASSSNTKQGLVKGTSLLVKSSNVSPGTSLLLRNPTTSNAMSILATSKPPVDPKLAIPMSSRRNLSKRLHTDQGAATRHLLNSLPIVTSKSSDSAYKAAHPYTAESKTAFLNWPVAKQRASEWTRANMIRKLLTSQGFSEEEEGAWTTKDIMQWARLWGYSPSQQNNSFFSPSQSDREEEPPKLSNPACTFSEPKEVQQWLSSHENEKVGSRDENNDEEIDVLENGPAPKRGLAGSYRRMGLGARAAVSRKVIVLGMESSLRSISQFVDETAREMGIVVSSPEEVISCVFYSAAQRMLIEALKSFVNELIRSSLLFAFRRTSANPEIPLSIKTEDVASALLYRKEFDLLTNEGLSAEPEDSSNWNT